MIIKSKKTKPALLSFDQFIYRRDLIKELVLRDMKLRYKRSVLGVIWSLINPLAQLLILYFVFSFILDAGIDNFSLFLFSGLLAWNWFSSSLYGAAGTIVGNGMMIRRPGFPIVLLPVVTLITNLIHFVIAIPILFVFVWISGVFVGWSLLAFPIILVVQFVFTLSFAYLLAAIHVTFRDTEYILGIALTFGFYLCPIFYEPSLVPENFQTLYNLNPMVHIINGYREIFLYGSFPGFKELGIILAASTALLFVSYTYFNLASYRFAEEI